MQSRFLNDSTDVQWLKDTALKGVPLPSQWADFRSFVLQGNEDAPHAVNLYAAENPDHNDAYFRVRFVNESGAYAEACEYDCTDHPLGGLTELK